MTNQEMTEIEALKFLEQKENESAIDYLIRTREIYYRRALNKLTATQSSLKEIRENLDKIIKKDVKNGSFNQKV